MKAVLPFAVFLFAASAACAQEQRLYRVDSVTVTMTRSLPPIVYLDVKAQAASAGWQNLRLKPLAKRGIARDGVQEFEIIGRPPSGMAAQVITPVTVRHHQTMEIYDYWGKGKPLKGFRILARSNAVTEHMYGN